MFINPNVASLDSARYVPASATKHGSATFRTASGLQVQSDPPTIEPVAQAHGGAAITNSTDRLRKSSGQEQDPSLVDSEFTDARAADEAIQLARYEILTQSATATIAQANLNPKSTLRLLA